jgi:hypothetical protein
METQHYIEVNLREAKRRLANSRVMLKALPARARYQNECKTYLADVKYYRSQLAKAKKE